MRIMNRHPMPPPRLRERALIHPDYLVKSAEWYAKPRAPIGLKEARPALLRHAELACGGDWRRVVMDEDGSLTILNKPAWQPKE